MRRAEAAKKKALIKGGPFVPSNGPKTIGGSGGNFNTFSGKVEAFSAVEKPKAPFKHEPKNFLTNPPKKGTFGFLGTTFEKYPEYKGDPITGIHEAELKETADHKAKIKGGAFKVHTAVLSAPFDANPYFTDKGTPFVLRRGLIPQFNLYPLEPPAEKEDKEEKKKVTPFYPTKRPPPMESSGNVFGTLDKYPAHSDEPPKEKASFPHNARYRLT